jgi:P pilus assembly chaperone PapD
MTTTTLLNQVTGTGAGNASGGPSGKNSYQATVTGTGAVTATVVVEVSNNGTNWITLGTLNLSGTNVASDGIAPSNSARWEFSRGNVTAISGTGAAVTLLMSH